MGKFLSDRKGRKQPLKRGLRLHPEAWKASTAAARRLFRTYLEAEAGMSGGREFPYGPVSFPASVQ